MPGAPLSQIVQPFVGGDLANPKQGVESIPAVVPDAVLFVLGQGGGKLLQTSFKMTTTVYVIKYKNEKAAS